MKPIIANHVLYQIRRRCALVMFEVLPAIATSILKKRSLLRESNRHERVTIRET